MISAIVQVGFDAAMRKRLAQVATAPCLCSPGTCCSPGPAISGVQSATVPAAPSGIESATVPAATTCLVPAAITTATLAGTVRASFDADESLHSSVAVEVVGSATGTRVDSVCCELTPSCPCTGAGRQSFDANGRLRLLLHDAPPRVEEPILECTQLCACCQVYEQSGITYSIALTS